jgi:hypothetical protein
MAQFVMNDFIRYTTEQIVFKICKSLKGEFPLIAVNYKVLVSLNCLLNFILNI